MARDGDASPAELGRQALARMDAVLATRPRKDPEAFSAASRAVCALRDALIPRARAGAVESRALEQVNAALSVLLGGQFPLGEEPWPAIAAARESLAGIAAAL